MSEWEFVKVNSKGEPKFRRKTNETLEFVTSLLHELCIVFEHKPGATLLNIYHPQTRVKYQYYYTTGRWGRYPAYGGLPKKHYSSKNINEFLTKYFLSEYTPKEIDFQI